MIPTLGRIVLYTLTAGDAEEINRRRTTHAQIHAMYQRWPTGAQAHLGRAVVAEETCPAVIVGLDTSIYDACGLALQVFLNGTDVLWIPYSTEGVGPGHWQWPPRMDQAPPTVLPPTPGTH